MAPMLNPNPIQGQGPGAEPGAPADNPLMPGAGAPLPATSPDQAPAGPSAAGPVAPAGLENQYAALGKAKQTLSKVRVELDALTKLGDLVTHEDVVKSAGMLVASGLEPKALASLLADMPPEGQALQNWVKQHDEAVRVREAQAEQVHNQIRGQLGQEAMRSLLGQHMAESGGLPSPAGNALGLGQG